MFRGRCAFLFVCLLAALTCAAPGPLARADAAGLPSAAAAVSTEGGTSSGAGHGWAVVDTRDGARGTIYLFHLPPRVPGTSTAAAAPGQPGPARAMMELTRLPDAMAAHGGTLWLTFPPDTNTPAARRVETLAARPYATTGWTYSPPASTDLQPPLPATGTLVSFLALPEGPLALFDLGRPSDAQTGPPAPRWRLLALRADRWSDWPTPPALDNPDATARLALDLPTLGGDSTGAVALVQIPGQPAAAIVPVAPAGTPAPPQPRAATLPLPPAPLSDLQLLACDGQTIALWREPGAGGRVRLDSLAAGAAPVPLARPELPARFAAVPLVGLGRIMAIWAARPATASADAARAQPPGSEDSGGLLARPRPRPTIEALEISVFTGRELARGQIVREGPLRPVDSLLLGLLVLTLVLGLVFFLLRGDAAANLSLPPGTALAPTGRRCVAAAIDLLPGLALAGIATGRAPSEVIPNPAALAAGVPLLTLLGPLVLTLVMTAVLSTLLEWATGRSLGKRLVGLAVAQAHLAPTSDPAGDSTQPASDPADQTTQPPSTADARAGVSLWRAAVRNAIRWIPPLALLALMDQAGRHPGDLAAGTVVVEPLPDSGPPSAADDGPPPDERR